MTISIRIEEEKYCDTRQESCKPEVITESRNRQMQIEQVKELSKRFGLNNPEDIATILRISVGSARKIQKCIKMHG